MHCCRKGSAADHYGPSSVNGSVPTATPRSRRFARLLSVSLLLVLVAGIALLYLSQPRQATRLILGRAGNALGLEITASGGDYQLRGMPALVVHDVVAREPGTATALLRADRIALSLPWTTIRGFASGAGDADLVIERVELDRPLVDLDALQHWLAQRPPSKARLPTLSHGLQLEGGRLVARDWTVTGISIDLPRLAQDEPVSARARGRYRAGDIALPFDLAVVLSRPAAPAALGVAGNAELRGASWRLPARIVLSGMLRMDPDAFMDRAKLAVAAGYISGDTRLPFALGAAGTARYSDAGFALAPAGIAVHGKGTMPDLTAGGTLALADALELQLAGRLHGWPDGWPALPSPIDRSRSPLPFQLRYRGKSDLSGVAHLQLSRDASRVDARLRPSALTAWLDTEHLSPLPPLEGTLTTPRLDIAGAQLHGVQITLDDPALEGASP
jgi:hypothetical protein